MGHEEIAEHFDEQYYGLFDPPIELDVEQPYEDRLLGFRDSKRVCVYIRFVGPDHSARYRDWVTVPPSIYDSMTRRPDGWSFFVLMVGRLPDGQPWWSALYDERVLARPDVYPFAEKKGWYERGGFYRFDPHLAGRARLGTHDFTAPAVRRDVITVYRCPACGLLADLEPEDPDTKECPVCGVDEPMSIYERTWPPVRKAKKAS